MIPNYSDKDCQHCGTTFTPASPTHKYCGRECLVVGASSALLLRRYGISLEEYNELYEACGGKCQICDKPGTLPDKGFGVGLVVDHCHDSGSVRGLLCNPCNLALGHMQDNVNLVQKGLVYLAKNKLKKGVAN